LELIRYIHLNPLRAKLIQDLNELDKYPPCYNNKKNQIRVIRAIRAKKFP